MVSRNHHFVPKLLLRPWLRRDSRQQLHLWGYWWDRGSGKLACKRRGLDSFCFQLDLLTLSAHALGRDAIERVFFGQIDTLGAAARDSLLEHGPDRLTAEQRCDFARLLLSLDARRPSVVNELRIDAAEELRHGLDRDPEILSAMARAGWTEAPSVFYERHAGILVADRALASIQQLVDNPLVGGRLVNAHWHIVRLSRSDGPLVLSDRPLIRFGGFQDPGAAWLLPLTPHAAFVAVNDRANLDHLRRAKGHRLARELNVASARQAERFVFSVNERDAMWLPKYIGPRRGR